MRLDRLRSWLLVLAGAVVAAGLIALGFGTWDGSATTPRLGPAVHVSPAAVTVPTLSATPTPSVAVDEHEPVTHGTDGANAVDPAGPPAAGPDDEPDRTPDGTPDGTPGDDPGDRTDGADD